MTKFFGGTRDATMEVARFSAVPFIDVTFTDVSFTETSNVGILNLRDWIRGTTIVAGR